MSQTFTVTIPKYDGPFDLILEAIKDGRIDIFEISLTQITSAYFEYLGKVNVLDLNSASEFLLIAAYLIEMKSKKLLPQPEEFELIEEEAEIEEDLARHLAEYRLFKSAAEHLKQKKADFSRIYSRYHKEMLEPVKKEFFLTDVNLADLVNAFQRVYKTFAEEEAVQEIKDEEITLPQRIEEVMGILKRENGFVEFEKLFIRRTRMEVVVTFLSILELARNQKIKISQGEGFGNIYLRLNED